MLLDMLKCRSKKIRYVKTTQSIHLILKQKHISLKYLY